MKNRIESLRDLIKVQSSNGNWNCNQYMWGLANGMILAEHTVSGKTGEPKFHKKPKQWLDDRKKLTAKVLSKPMISTRAKAEGRE